MNVVRRIFLIFAVIILLVFLTPLIVITIVGITPAAGKEVTAPSKALTISVYDAEEDEVTEYELEKYLVGVVAAEMPASYAEEALKAQAVAARSYILSRRGSDMDSHHGADICNEPAHCKAYLSEEATTEKWGADLSKTYLEKIRRAVFDTEGQYLSYEGRAAVACFYAASGGRTENAADVWGTDTPYLRSVESPGDLSYENLITTAAVPLSEFSEKLGIDSPAIGDVTRTEGGSVKNISIGGKDFSGTQIRSIFGLKSANFDLEIGESEATFTSRGSGHGVGMSQYGANQMALSGKNYTEILLHYYSNVTIENL